ncbi:HPr kinase/phosphorylase [Emcibacter nanhaiensis]|uniref:Serine/threonine protein kinase n=1 Tax=Emcibacter nanhaiensis TaxID=1505037 RepID=A0A501PN09_9PROT|nr:HPr kinase/phosphatase C-terminal domain-containing protein [Emcibacter nanhaiensis]TPD61833.1 serine/threonine protein kinase [Emcibacter nanhaiensis]
MTLFHATVVSLEGRGIMISGPSGSGKSDLALRLIEEAGARLVGDDYVTLTVEGGRLWARPADNISGLIEVRGVGLVKMDFLPSAALDLVFILPQPASGVQPERLPEEQYFEHEGIRVRQLDFLPFEVSAVAKIKAALRHVLS